VAAPWKYSVVADMAVLVSQGLSLRDAAKAVMGKDYGVPKEALAKVTQAVARSPKVLDLLVERDLEHRALKEATEFFSKEFGLPVRVELEEESRLPRKDLSLPGKPAIYVER